MRAWIARAAVVTSLGALAWGCNGSRGESTAAPRADATAAASTAPDPASQVLARVGDRTITLADYTAALQHMDPFDRLRFQAPDRRKELLHEMIDVMLLADEARERGYDKDPQAEEEVRQILRDAVREKARRTAPAPADIPATEVADYFQAHKADFHDPERRRVSAIVLASPAAAAQALDAAKNAKDGAAWGEIVRTRSVDPQARNGAPADLAGDLGFVNPPGDTHPANPRVPEEVRAGVFEVEHVGDVLPRVVKGTGTDGKTLFYVVKLASKSDGHDRSLQDAERSIRVKLAQNELHAREAALIENLRKEFPPTIDEAALSQVRVRDLDAGH